MALSNMQVFNQFIMPATIETLAQMVDVFNQASAGAIRLTTDGFDGDFLQESFFAAIHSAQRRVNRYGVNATVAPTDLRELKHSTVKVAGGFGPILFEPSQMTWLQRPTTQGIEVASRNFAEAMLADQLNTAILALVAAIGNQPGATNDVSTDSGIDYVAMNNAHAKFGDASGNLVANVMTGAMSHKLIEQNLKNEHRLFQAGNVRVYDVLGKRTVVTDAPALFSAGTPGLNKVLSLAAGAAVVHDASDLISNVQTDNGKERITTTLQIDYTFGLGLLGYAWNETVGGKSPTDAALGAGSNWVKVASSIKNTAGVLTIGNASK